MSGFAAYQTFGLRKAWLHEFLADPETWWHTNALSNRQLRSAKLWLRQAELVKESSLTELGAALRALGPDRPLTWAIIWVTLAHNSSLIRWYVGSVPWGATYTKKDLVEMMGDGISVRTRESAAKALIGTLRDTPLGNMGLGMVLSPAKDQAQVAKSGWSAPEPLAILFSLYRYAEAIGRHNLCVSELLDSPVGGPALLFGLSRRQLVPELRGISSRWPRWLSTEIVVDLDNLYLDASRKATEVLRLVED
jgi:phosphoadenosine phosphosulfate reductase